ncbi:SDR family NAD(P)-dependent oxidoreductase [Aeromicrobium chenweiae]|uniref:3-ketoacyl-ACP reductase n=1 Tax=Aeromicrobium chenweiae TaxID=2079793 RepID=A0A2S0WIU0_9ACTN|nr:SDR family NAD(P)-dependent oxidoreductase [Aeromicrobium chenweiae]AWB91259.1 3-ketoacyl-ACP reductase [Aeromicrobium chenweiae]TGN31777.1 SDR family oxidoreductase [Aeromicrobium chenweiae]
MSHGLLQDRVVVVTGGSSGNGRAIALAAAAQGARAVVVADVVSEPREGGRPTHEVIGGDSLFVSCDVSQPDSIEAAVAAADPFGGVDVLVNNAGIVGPASRVVEMDPADFDQVLAVNLRGTFLGCRAAGRRMAERGSGSIVNVASIAGILGSRSSAAYSASKAGILLMTSTLAFELGSAGVRVNSVLPGIIETHMTTVDRTLATDAYAATVAKVPLGRLGTPDDIANAVVYLASTLAGYVTGSSLVVDGGLIATVP